MAVTLGGSSKLKWTGTAPLSAYPFSIFCWVKFATTSTVQCLGGIGKDGNTADGEGTIFAYGGIDQKLRAIIKISGGGQEALSASSMDTSWQPALAVFASATSRKIYYAAGAVGTDTSSASPVFANWDEIIVGERPSEDASYYLNGDIAEFTLWSADMSSHWATLQGDNKPELVNGGANLVEHWKLETAGDYTGTVSRTLSATGSVSTGSTHPITRSGGSSTTPPQSALQPFISQAAGRASYY